MRRGTQIEASGASSLAVSDLTSVDLPHIRWAGSEAYLENVAAALERVGTGDVEYLAVRSPDGLPVSIGGIDYARHSGAGSLMRLSTHESLRSLGLGTRLIEEAERRVRQRGLRPVVLGVEVDNERAFALNQRLGYRRFGHEQASWNVERAERTVVAYVAECDLLEKQLE